MRPTSLLAWDEIQRHLPQSRAMVLAQVMRKPGGTGREIEAYTGDRKANARLSELERQGLIEAREPVVCSVTGRLSIAWFWTGNTIPRPLPAPKVATRKELVERIEMLEILLAQAGREALP